MALATNKPEPPPAPPLSPDPAVAQMLADVKLVEAAEAKKKEAQLDPTKRHYIIREIRIDKHTIRRYRELLTPSMCRLRGCNYDAAKWLGFGSWQAAPLKEKLRTGQTVKERILEALGEHNENAHKFDQAHIISEDELIAQKAQTQRVGNFLRQA